MIANFPHLEVRRRDDEKCFASSISGTPDLHVTNKNSFIMLLVNKVACFASAPRRKLWSKYLMLDITRRAERGAPPFTFEYT
jgi:hypothetical protein